MLIAFLHGFWGQGSDSQVFFDALCELCPNQELRLWAPDLFQEASFLSPDNDFSHWAQRYEESLRERAGAERVALVGYSLGGRLALHGLARICQSAAPLNISLAVFLSSNPGLVDKRLLRARRQWEREWAERFRADGWDDLIRDWNQLSVFSHTGLVQRRQQDFSRRLLAVSLERWSVTRHEACLDDIKGLSQLWCFGSKDAKYRALGERMLEQRLVRGVHFLAHAGHRLLVDRPRQLAHLIAPLL
jgi:2-succinyl-6-hydroxy-2,4-cyclohexadiene-1-carboxylate synthase